MQSYGSADRINFKVNGVKKSVGCEVSSDVMLVDYLRDYLELRGTKYMCREGGCGACCVSVRKCADGPLVAVNSCMVLITSCQDWEITTIEEIGNGKKGYHVLQKTLAEHHGTQCGYCSPAWIQNMYCLLQDGNQPTMLDIEKSFAGNICRCTGYRPIMDAFKNFAIDAPKDLRITDIEDLHKCKRTGLTCNKNKCDDEDDWYILTDEDVKASTIIKIKLEDDKFWYKVCDLKSIFYILDDMGYDSYMLVYGNTGKGAYPITDYPNIMIDISSVSELKCCTMDQNLIIGVGITLNEFLEVCKAAAVGNFTYLKKFVEHMHLIANIPIRNLGSVGGNLMLKHQHNEFASDIFLLCVMVGAYLEIYSSIGISKKVSMEQFLQEDMKGKIIVNVILPPLNSKYKYESYKIMPRSQNAHAIVNAGFLYKLSQDNIVIEARIAYGGLSPCFIRAEATEKFLIGKQLFSNATLQSGLNTLENEMIVIDNPPSPSVKCRKQLALSLFYKGLLSMSPNCELNSRYLSGSTKIHETRPLSKGKQVFETDPSLWPLTKPIPKIEALMQCAGESKYSDDLPTQPREVYAAFVLSTVAVGDLVKIDASQALKHPKVIAFYTADDIPGENGFTPTGFPLYSADEKVFSDGKIFYYNQPIGIIVAKTQQIANKAAKMVTATYKNVKEPVTEIEDAKGDESRVHLFISEAATEKGTDVVETIKGKNKIYGQLHVAMELMSCVTLPTEEGLEVHVTSQWTDAVQDMVAKALGINANCIDVYVRRLGGSFGLKISRSIQTAVACSLVVHKLNRPCRLVVPFTTCTRAVGKRLPCLTEFECNVSAAGVIQSIVYKQYGDSGFMTNELLSLLASDAYNNCYTNTKWNYELYNVITDTAKNTWCRAPGTLESIAMAEHVLERISYVLSLDPFDVRIANIDATKYNDLKIMAEDVKKSSSYIERKAAVATFNKNNRWKKRGIRVSFLRWSPVGFLILDVNLSVCHSDGTVILTHGGIEMGQGINTKAVQICAYMLKIPIDKIKVKGNNTIIAPNCFLTGGSLGSQNVGLAVKRCCETLLGRLEPIRAQMVNPTWQELILKAHESSVDLQIHSYVGSSDMFPMDIFGVAVAEVEIDCLTGEFEIIRVDILQDVGQSVSPEIDVGQVEGAFVMGLGYWTCENLVYKRKTGELLTDRTWDYYVPMAKDTPQDFRVTFRQKSYSVDSIFGSKCTGEPPTCLPVVVAFALRAAITDALKDIGVPTTTWLDIDGPFTLERILLACGARKEDFKFN